MWILFGIISLFFGDIYGIFIALIFGFIQAIWMYFVRFRIPFASTMLELSINASNKFYYIYFVSFLGILIQVIWVFIWLAGLAALIYVATEDDDTDTSDDTRNPNNNSNSESSVSIFLIVLFILSFYWTSQV